MDTEEREASMLKEIKRLRNVIREMSDGQIQNVYPEQPLTKEEIEKFKESFTNFPSYCRKLICDDGIPFLMECLYREPNCACRIHGNGSIRFPLQITFCKKHSE